MKFYQSQVLANLENFRVAYTYNSSGLMRERIDMFLLWKTIEYFQPKNLLEIGFFAGQTAGIITESAGPDATLTSVDIDFSRRIIFEKIFLNHNINFIKTDSLQLELDSNKKYDFISIDGNHDYSYVLNDFNKCFPHMHKNTILYMDDYCFPGVEQVICEELLGKNDFVPFMMGDQAMFFHHISHSADEFLDEWIQDKSKNFIYFENVEIFGVQVLRSRLPNIFVEHPTLFTQALEFYKL
jgi:predicted O-methyltransferase YrrM